MNEDRPAVQPPKPYFPPSSSARPSKVPVGHIAIVLLGISGMWAAMAMLVHSDREPERPAVQIPEAAALVPASLDGGATEDGGRAGATEGGGKSCETVRPPFDSASADGPSALLVPVTARRPRPDPAGAGRDAESGPSTGMGAAPTGRLAAEAPEPASTAVPSDGEELRR